MMQETPILVEVEKGVRAGAAESGFPLLQRQPTVAFVRTVPKETIQNILVPRGRRPKRRLRTTGLRLWSAIPHGQFPPTKGTDKHLPDLPKEVVTYNSLLLTGGKTTERTTH